MCAPVASRHALLPRSRPVRRRVPPMHLPVRLPRFAPCKPAFVPSPTARGRPLACSVATTSFRDLIRRAPFPVRSC